MSKNFNELNTLASGQVDRATDVVPINDITAVETKKITPNALMGISGGTAVSTTDTQTVQNKTLDNTNAITVKDNILTLQDNSDTTKQAQFQLSGITTATTRTLTVPDASTTLVGTDATQTLTNKTINNPVLKVDSVAEFTAANGVSIDGLNIKDSKLNTNNSVVTANVTNGSITADKLGTGAQVATVATSQTTTSATFTDLSTVGPAVTVTIGANGLALVMVHAHTSNSGANTNLIGVDISGATTVASTDARSAQLGGTTQGSASLMLLIGSLNAGSTTFTLKYRTTGGTATYIDRTISVVPL